MRVTRRNALIGAAALFAPFPEGILAAPANTPVEKGALIRLDGNENPYGPSPAAREAILASVGEAPRYADETITTLTRQLAAHEGVADSQILIGAGSGELLRVAGLYAMTTAPGSELVACKPTYEELPRFAEKLGLKVRWVAPEDPRARGASRRLLHLACGPRPALRGTLVDLAQHHGYFGGNR
jgi:histidinol-phosphate aminotransferase